MSSRRSFTLGAVAAAIMAEAAWAAGVAPESYQRFQGSAPPVPRGTVRKAYVEASNAAIRATVEDHNAVMAKIRIDQEAAKAESEGK